MIIIGVYIHLNPDVALTYFYLNQEIKGFFNFKSSSCADVQSLNAVSAYL